ncbi:hypothetical protein LguiA_004355 [Lonicera macranthoides]
MADNRGNGAAEGWGESGQGFNGKKSNFTIYPPKKKLVKEMMAEKIAEVASSAVNNFKNKKKINPTDDHDPHRHASS